MSLARRVARAVWSRPAVVATLMLTFAWAVTLTLFPWSDESVGDLGVRRQFATALLDGALPYRDFAFEYPPLAAPWIAAPGLVGTGVDGYWAGFAILTLGLAALVVVLTGRLAAATGADPRWAMLAAAAFPLLAGAIVRVHFDLAPVALTLAAVLAILSRRPALGFALLGVGAMTKLFPIVVVPVALAWLIGRGDRAGALRGAAAVTATLLALAAATVALSPDGALAAARYQLERPVQIESSPASVLLAADALGAGDARSVASHKSTGTMHPLSSEVSAGFTAALVGCLMLIAVLTARRDRAGGEGPEDGRRLVLAALAAIVAFAALGRVLSPQYVIWAMPALGLAVGWRMWPLAAALATGTALTLAEFPSRYVELVAGDPVAVAITGARNAAFLLAVALAVAALTRRSPARAAAVRSTAPARRLRPR